MTCPIAARREPVPPQFGIGWKELLGHVPLVPVSAPNGSATDYAGFIVEKDIDLLLLSSLAKPDPSALRKTELFIPYGLIQTIFCTSAQPFGVSLTL